MPNPAGLRNTVGVSRNGYIYLAGAGKGYRYDPATGTWDDAAVPDPALPAPEDSPEAAAEQSEAAQALMAGAEQALSPFKSEGPQVVLTSMGVRRYLKRFLTARFPTWSVLSFQELPPSVQVQAVGRLSLQQAPARRPVGVKM